MLTPSLSGRPAGTCRSHPMCGRGGEACRAPDYRLVEAISGPCVPKGSGENDVVPPAISSPLVLVVVVVAAARVARPELDSRISVLAESVPRRTISALVVALERRYRLDRFDAVEVIRAAWLGVRGLQRIAGSFFPSSNLRGVLMPSLPDDEMRLLSSPEAEELGELYLLQKDLDHCVKAFRLLVEIYGEREFSEAENLIRLALYRDAIVQFIACFDGSAPLFLKVPDVYPGDENAQSYFNSLKDIRDGYAAHRHGPSRQCAVGVVAGLSGTFATGRLLILRHVPPIADLKHHHDFALKARLHVDARIASLERTVTTAAMAMSREQILALPGAHGYNVREGEARLARRRFLSRRGNEE